MGIIIDEELAKISGCTCHAIGPTNKPKDLMCFSPGVVGTLTNDQDIEFCKIGRLIIRDDKIKERVEIFKKASEICNQEVRKYPKGERLIPRIECMKRELRK